MTLRKGTYLSQLSVIFSTEVFTRIEEEIERLAPTGLEESQHQSCPVAWGQGVCWKYVDWKSQQPVFTESSFQLPVREAHETVCSLRIMNK